MKMLKMIASICLASIMLSAVAAGAEAEAEPDNLITFYGFPWYSTKGFMESSLQKFGCEPNTKPSTFIYCTRGTWFDGNYYEGTDCIFDGGIQLIYHDIAIYGHTPSTAALHFMYPIADIESSCQDEDTAQLYMAEFHFSGRYLNNLDYIYNDLIDRQSSLYGRGENISDDNYFRHIWDDKEGNISILFMFKSTSADSSWIKLIFEASGAEDRLDEIEALLDSMAESESESE